MPRRGNTAVASAARASRTGLQSAALLSCLLSCLLSLACGSSEPAPPFAPTDPAGSLFAPDHVVEVAVEMAPQDWDALRRQTRDWWDVAGADNRQCLLQPFAKPFSWYEATVTVDGIRRERVAVRKKGFLGSLDDERPALKIRFDADAGGQKLLGLSRLTLNNSVQDASWLRQCLAYRVFEKAGVPVPWCNFAHVTANGRDLGLYVNVESMDRHWVRRYFERDEGELWEGEWSDFDSTFLATFEKKGDVEDDDQRRVDRSSLEEVARAIAPNLSWDRLRSDLAKTIDFDEFMRLWAAEKVLEHWDGYANNSNNFFVYRDPATKRFVFAPSGTDQITVVDPFTEVLPPVSVYARGAIARRLYAEPEGRQLYASTLKSVLDSAFDESALLAETERMQTVIAPVLARMGPKVVQEQSEEAAALRSWIGGRRATLLADLRYGPRDWSEPRKTSFCVDLAGELEGEFATSFGTNRAPDIFRVGNGTLAGVYRTLPGQRAPRGLAGRLRQEHRRRPLGRRRRHRRGRERHLLQPLDRREPGAVQGRREGRLRQRVRLGGRRPVESTDFAVDVPGRVRRRRGRDRARGARRRQPRARPLPGEGDQMVSGTAVSSAALRLRQGSAAAAALLLLLAGPLVAAAQDTSAAPPAPSVAKPDDLGFHWLRFDLRGRVLARGFSDAEDGTSESDFEAENARLELRWRPSRGLRAVVEADAADDDTLKDAYLALRSSSFEARAGQFKPPVSPIEMSSRWDLPASERGLLSELLSYSYGITGRRPGVQGGWNPRGRGASFAAGVFAGSSLRGDRIGDEAFDNVAWDWGALKASARLAHTSNGAELGMTFDLRPAEPVPGEGYRHFWTAGADATWGGGRKGPRAWLEGYVGSSWQDGNAFDGQDTTFLAGRALGSWRFALDKRRALFLEPYAIAALVEPDTGVREDLLWEAGAGLQAGAFGHLRLVLEVQRRELSRNAPASLGLLPLGETAPYSRTRLVAQLGAAF